jgi:hypothetical protein
MGERLALLVCAHVRLEVHSLEHRLKVPLQAVQIHLHFGQRRAVSLTNIQDTPSAMTGKLLTHFVRFQVTFVTWIRCSDRDALFAAASLPAQPLPATIGRHRSGLSVLRPPSDRFPK